MQKNYPKFCFKYLLCAGFKTEPRTDYKKELDVK